VSATFEARVLCSSVAVHVAARSVCAVCASRTRKGHTLLMGVNVGAVALVP
jgi:hypothetical protein